jgi:hypothetical protein
MGSIPQGTGACDGKEDCPSPESVCKTHAELSAAARKRISEATKKRWAAYRANKVA